MSLHATILIQADEMRGRFNEILLKLGFEKSKAWQCASIFTENSLDGVYTHGVNRFPVFVQHIKEGIVNKDAVPELNKTTGSIEQWNGNAGPGPLNAVYAADRAMELSKQQGIGCVAMANTNHWMRGGYYGWHVAKKGFAFIGWTNTISAMSAWNALDSRLGNNPLVIAVPFKDEAIVLDMAMSQFSFGAMQMAVLKNEKLSVVGGYDKEGNITNDPQAIIETRRTLPVGYWKGAGLSLLLDILAAMLSGGLSTHEISSLKKETNISQVFICINISMLPNYSSIPALLDNIISDYHQSVPFEDGKKILYPGERVAQTRKYNLANGIPVIQAVWDEILQL